MYLTPISPFPVSPLPQIKIPNPVPDCPPPFFSQFKNQPSPPAPIHLHRSTSGPSRIHPFPESEVRSKLQTSSTFEFQRYINNVFFCWKHSVCQCLKNKKTLYIFRCFSDLFLLGLIQ
ncbi:hypothetical protein ES332_D10G104100v1 [Gossypium tomentosum]|uniref:Uncharacterized protein n=1 Tax=Gossypium tomentosum TaxID=34277 RepID=A0A5D2J3Z2_GOSTO|nr:hypothetical protein ES332_D10G104100v1 [Gossypium tomentosum]